ncbi:hypothetical protein CGSSpBS293_01967 [Streptococcus pneumoniae SP-BS293]|nr:hypothetical protein CGSSp14BS292_01838 [Streptococcus pneumoniae SP14-BS292]EFL69995.1 hypothetical protein CGSSpBS293_01967 [Streptococcus pneumoniae SP-BS293]EFL70883.1 hypothetical protein CGSSpBS458_02569 [Streptococcus pneumoniae BS458]EFL74022.1 hypothetical protein CGSSpBS457_04212 [Streptococcus pneumoniae BS457]EFL77201.1 hypothetical protein CGSSpBS397_02521 [Streptococcus pneumoniae BS397]
MIDVTIGQKSETGAFNASYSICFSGENFSF